MEHLRECKAVDTYINRNHAKYKLLFYKINGLRRQKINFLYWFCMKEMDKELLVPEFKALPNGPYCTDFSEQLKTEGLTSENIVINTKLLDQCIEFVIKQSEYSLVQILHVLEMYSEKKIGESFDITATTKREKFMVNKIINEMKENLSYCDDYKIYETEISSSIDWSSELEKNYKNKIYIINKNVTNQIDKGELVDYIEKNLKYNEAVESPVYISNIVEGEIIYD